MGCKNAAFREVLRHYLISIAFMKERKISRKCRTGILFSMTIRIEKDDEKMSKKKNKQKQYNPAMPKTDVEFAQTGLEKVALQALEKTKK